MIDENGHGQPVLRSAKQIYYATVPPGDSNVCTN